jgi:hypothetical protein
MPKRIIVVLALLSWFHQALAADITITTYLPSPYATYVELRVDRVSVGSSYRGQGLSDGDMLVSGRFAIGTSTPATVFDVRADRLGGYHTAFFRGSNDIGIGVGGYTNAGGPLSLASIQAMTYNTSTGQPLLVNGSNGGLVRIGASGSLGSPIPYQLDVQCANSASCLGGRLDNTNSGQIEFQWCAGGSNCSASGYYGWAIYD